MHILPDSIRGRVITLIAAITLPLLATLGWVFVDQVNRDHAEARDLALRIARSTASDVEDSHTRARALLARMAERPLIQEANASRCDSLFAIVDFFPQYPNLQLFDLTGRVLCSAKPAPVDAPYSAAAEEAVARAIPGRTPFDEPMIVLARDRWITVEFQPISANGRIVGVLALQQYLDLTTDAYPPGTVITIAHATRRVILARSHDARLWIGRIGNASASTRAATNALEGRLESFGIDGVERQYGFRRVRPLPWTIFVGLPSNAAMAAVRSLLVRGFLIGGVVIALVAVLGIRITRTIENPLATLTMSVKRAAAPGTTEQVAIEGPREVQVVAQAFNEMVRSRTQAEDALLESRQQLEGLSEKLLDVQEEERTRIAREIHDDLGQLLTALNMDVGGLLTTADLSPEQRTMARRIRQALAEMLAAVQRIAAELRPAVLDDFGLVAAIELDLERFEQRTGIECDLSAPAGIHSFGADADAAIYRIVQEALTNVARHSHASRVEIRLRIRDDELLVEVRDDGRGIPQDALSDRGSIGLIGMRERARRIGGRLDVEGIPGHGTIVLLRLPISREAQRVRA